MLPDAVLPVPASLMTLLAVFCPLFTVPSFRTFSMLACGFLAQSGETQSLRDAHRCRPVAGLEP